jgi:hypothetical protein
MSLRGGFLEEWKEIQYYGLWKEGTGQKHYGWLLHSIKLTRIPVHLTTALTKDDQYKKYVLKLERNKKSIQKYRL